MKDSILQHLAGVGGQVAAALPLLTVTALLARTAGLETAGRFTVMVGLSAAVFVAAQWGFRTAVVLDRFRRFSPWVYVEARTLALCAASLLVLYAGFRLRVGWALSLTIVCYRLSDGIIDLQYAFLQALRGTASALRSYFVNHTFKLAVLGLAIALSLAVRETGGFRLLLGSGCAVLAGAVWVLLKSLPEDQSRFLLARPAELLQAFRRAWWFAASGLACALVTNSARFSLAWIYDGELLGVVGVALSVSTFFGMVFYTTWVRYLPRFRSTGLPVAAALGFVVETMVLCAILVVASWWVLPPLVSLVFGFSRSDFMLDVRKVLIASVVFFGGMNLVNLFKVTRVAWMEAASYLATLVWVGGSAALLPYLRDMPLLLCLAGLSMLAMGALAFPFLGGKTADEE